MKKHYKLAMRLLFLVLILSCIPIKAEAAVEETSISSAQCGTTLPAINSNIYANLVPGAQGYRFKVTDLTTNQVQTIEKSLRVFNLTQLSNYAYNRTYSVEVAVKIESVFQLYGNACLITTPTPTSRIQESQCGITLTTFNSTLFANLVPYAKGYKFKFTNTVTNEVFEFERPLRDIRINNLPRIYQQTYSVQVAVKNTDDSYLPYGESCQVSTPIVPVPAVVNCGTISNYTLNATSVAEATLYHFEFVHEYFYQTGINAFYYQFTSSTPTYNVVSYYNPYHTYYVRVRAEINGVLGAFSDFCTVPGNYQGVPDARLSSTYNESFFDVNAAPNPFSDTITLKVNSSDKSSIEIKVYDMVGKLIDHQLISDLEAEIGSDYPSGIYNVTVVQNNQSQNIRMIKR